MNWDDLRYVLAVSRQRTLSAAGRDLGVDPTTVGRRIAAIETELGCRMFDRTSEGYATNFAGEIAVRHATEMEHMAVLLERALEGGNEKVEGPVRITALDGLVDHLLVPALPELLARHPLLELTFSSEVKVLDLSPRDVDIAVTAARSAHPDAINIRLGRQAMALYTARHARLPHPPPVIGLPRQLDSMTFSRFLARIFPESRVVARGNTEGHIVSLARAGVGVGLVDCFIGDRDPALRRFTPDVVEAYDMWAVVHVGLRGVPRVRAVLDFLAELYAANTALLAGDCPAVDP